MALIVQKFGGSSVGTLDRIHHVANRIIKTKREGHTLVVVVSAMYGETDRLIQLAHSLTHYPDPREFDLLLSTGEQVAMTLLSMALNARDCPSRSFTGPRVGIHTDNVHSNARITHINTDLIRQELAEDRVVVIAGFQGLGEHGEITTLGRGGSDTTAVAVASALNADECQIYTDVDGVYTTDPHVLSEARLLPAISFEEMLEMASLGAKVLQMRCVELASKANMPIRVLSTFSDGPGTLVTFEDKVMQKHIVSGIAFSREEAMISLSGIPKHVGYEAQILDLISKENIEIDMIAQNVTRADGVEFSFTLSRRAFPKALSLINQFVQSLDKVVVSTNAKVAKLSLVGLGMRSHAGVASTMFNALKHADIPIQMITTSEIKISILIEESQLETGIRTMHRAFQLDKLPLINEPVTLE